MSDPRYPIGRFEAPNEFSPTQRSDAVAQIERTPASLRAALEGLDERQLATPYREEGWSVGQVAHHLADSHMNAFIRFKLALTEEEPTIKPYSADGWAGTGDNAASPNSSGQLLSALHERWVTLLRSMAPDDFARQFLHPQTGRAVSLDSTLALYAWHGPHHVAHITSLRDREGW